MDKGISPEEKLLRLIRGKDEKKSNDKTAFTESLSVKKKAHIGLESFKPVKKYLKLRISPFLKFKTLNIFLFFLSVALLIYSLIEFLSPIKGRIKKISRPIKAQEQKVAEFKISQSKDYDYYHQQFAKRDIFNAPLLAAKTDFTNLNANIKEALKNLKLVGIVLDDESPEVVIEDKRTKTTYFLHKGESLDSLEVKEIQDSKVILIYSGEEFELEL
jgi:type II secretory pathway component PulC